MPLKQAPGADPVKSKDEKLLRALKKKLRGMEPLIAKQSSGELLSDAQLQKLESLDSVLADLAEASEAVGAARERAAGRAADMQRGRRGKAPYPVVEELRDRGYFNEEDEESNSDAE